MYSACGVMNCPAPDTQSCWQAIAFIAMEIGCLLEEQTDLRGGRWKVGDAEYWNTPPYRDYFEDLSARLAAMDDEAAFAYCESIQHSHAPLLGNTSLRTEQFPRTRSCQDLVSC